MLWATHRSSSATGTSRSFPRRTSAISGWTCRSKESRLIPSDPAASSRVSVRRGRGPAVDFVFTASTVTHGSDRNPPAWQAALQPQLVGLLMVIDSHPSRRLDQVSYMTRTLSTVGFLSDRWAYLEACRYSANTAPHTPPPTHRGSGSQGHLVQDLTQRRALHISRVQAGSTGRC
jgi:hypothetical protein